MELIVGVERRLCTLDGGRRLVEGRGEGTLGLPRRRLDGDKEF